MIKGKFNDQHLEKLEIADFFYYNIPEYYSNEQKEMFKSQHDKLYRKLTRKQLLLFKR
jgi:hypothetical protein